MNEKEIYIDGKKVKIKLDEILKQLDVDDFRDIGVWIADHDTLEEDLFNNLIDFGYGIFCLRCRRHI